VKPERPLAYIYGVADAPAPRELPAVEAILPGAPIEAHASAGLVAFVSPVGPDTFGADALADADEAWLIGRALAHAQVLAALMPRRALVPLRFGTVCRDVEEVGDFLERQRPMLSAALERVRGAAEWGVKLHCDPAALGAAVERELPAAREAVAARATATPGRGFFLAKRIAPIVAAESAARVAACIDETHRRLVGAARASAPLNTAPTGQASIVATSAYLVAHDRLGDFRERLSGLAADFAASGLRHELTGPWPPYNFVSCGDGAATDTRANGR
jgi:hypothetical protein